jgi:hypothetical protein
MSVYKWASQLKLPVYAPNRLPINGAKPKPAGYLRQGTKLLPCIVMRGGQPIPHARAQPFVGYEVLLDEPDTSGMNTNSLTKYQDALPDRLAAFRRQVDSLKDTRVPSHECAKGYAGPVINARLLVKLSRAPPAFREPKREKVVTAEDTTSQVRALVTGPDQVRELATIYHDSKFCASVNKHVHGRRNRMLQSWRDFVDLVESLRPEMKVSARLASQADIVARTATFEGDLVHGCTAHGLCEIDLITLSVRNRGDHTRCSNGDKQFACKYKGDYASAAASVTQYNIWDHLFTMKDSITSCYLRSDLSPERSYAGPWLDRFGEVSDDARAKYRKEQARFSAAFSRTELILSTPRAELKNLFRAENEADIHELRHYFHPKAMGKCLPRDPRQEYMPAAYVKRGDSFFLLLRERVLVGASIRDPVLGQAFEFSLAEVASDSSGVERVIPTTPMPDVLVASSRVALGTPSRCTPYGVEASCKFDKVLRHRRTPPWLTSGTAARVTCRNVPDGPKDCSSPAADVRPVTLGGRCSIDFMPMSRVP